ncbi:hypothetical protein NMG60_11007569 [Bertholletia excelsa]
MERDKARRSMDESEIAKAAAWAWWRRELACDGKLGTEFDLTRVRQIPKPKPKPSWYKLEAVNGTAKEETEQSRWRTPSALFSPSHVDGSDLLDSYEIQRIARQLDYYILASNLEYRGECLGSHRRIVPSPESEAKGKKKSKGAKGFWVRHGLTCGSSNDVVEAATGFGERRPPEEKVVAGSAASCRPRAAHA